MISNLIQETTETVRTKDLNNTDKHKKLKAHFPLMKGKKFPLMLLECDFEKDVLPAE